MTTISAQAVTIRDGIIIWDPYRFMKIDHLLSQKNVQTYGKYQNQAFY